MSNSFATTAQLTCSDCGQSFQADLWLLVDSAERPDLLELARNGTLHDIDCPHCDQTNRVNAPTLLYRPELLTNGLSDTPLIFLSADGLDAAREAEQARRLLGMLAASLGTDWQDGWLHDAPGLPVDFFLAGDSVAPFSPSTALSPSAAAGGGLGRGDEIPNELRPLLEFMAALPEDQRDALTHIFAQASSPEDALASLESQPALRDAVADFLGDSGSFRTPSHFESDRRVAQEAEASYRSGGGLASLHRAADAWNRILDHPTFVTTDPRFRLAVWNDAAIVFARRHSAQGRMGDLDRALELWQAAVAETPAGSPDRPMFLSNLGNGLSARFARNGRMQDLEEAIRVYEAAVAETPAGSPDRPSRLNNLGNGLRSRFARSGRVADLEEAIRVHEAAVAETPAGSPDRPSLLNNLGTGLSARFARNGRMQDLEEAIRVYEAAVAETPAGSPDRPSRLNNLGNGLRARFARSGRVADLEEAIRVHEAAVAETPAGSPDRPSLLNNLGNGLRARFARSGRVADLEEAIRVYEAAVAETPAGSPDRPSLLNNLGNGLRARFARSGRVADLEEAIRVHEAAVAETPAGSPDRPGYLNNLGTGLSDRFARSGRVADLEEAIRVYEAAVAETPAGSPDRPGYLNNLGTGLSDRFARSGRVADLEEAIRVYEAAVAETPAGSPDRPSRLNNLGTGLSDRFARSGRVADLEEATNAYRAACELGVLTAPEGSLRAGRNWARWAVTRPAPNFVDAAQAGAFALDSVDALFGVQLERSAQESFLKEAQGIHTTTAYALARQALDDASSFLFQQAVETVERGQARLLAQALEENRADLDRLEAVEQDQLYADYQANLAQRSALLAQLEAAPDSAVRSALNGQLRANKDERDGLVKRIQAVPGFEDFLVRPSFARIAAALTPRPPLSPAGEGESEPHPSPPHFGEGADARASDDASSATRASISPSPGTGEVGRGSFLVYLLASPAGGLALIVHREDGAEPATVTPVWLDGLTEEWLRALVYGPAEGSALGGYLGAYSRSRSDPQGWLNTLDNTCRQLWDVAMGPLAEALAALDSRSPDQTQSAHHQPAQSSIPVTLIPTGLLGLLPLQAAFTDRSNAGGDALPNSAFAVPRSAFSTRRYFLDGFAVNYATSAIALGHSQERVLQATSERILAVTEPWPVGEVRLPNARPQAIAIANLFPLSSQLEGHQATRSALLDRLPDTDVFHFFGHGNTDWGNPLESTLWCADNERLTVRDLLAQRLPGARLAVLSACETGIAGQQLPDETVNLSSALVQAGFAGVVASLWSVYEISTAMLIVRFYHYWRVDGLAPTDALRSAQLWLRDTTNREKADFFGQFVPGLQTEIAGQLGSEFFEDLYDREEGLDAYSFAHPMHWAAFTLTGV